MLELNFKAAVLFKQNSNLKILSEHFVLSYDAPTKFYNRRNEILIQVNYSD